MSEWQDISTAPKGKPMRPGAPSYSWMLLLHGDGDDRTVSLGMRFNDDFFVGAIFHRGGPWNERQYEFREMQVYPTHWMPLPPPPARANVDEAQP